MAAQNSDDRQVFIELEYMLNKYLNEHCAGMVNSEIKAVETRRAKEYADMLNRRPVAPGASGLTHSLMVAQETNRTGEWSSKNADELIKIISDKITGNKQFANDLRLLTDEWRKMAKAKLGEAEYNRLSQFFPHKDMASDYIISRCQSFIMEQMAKGRVPKSSLEYILKKGYGESLIGTVSSMLSGVPEAEADERLERMTEAMYAASPWERAGSMAVSIGLDMVTLGGSPTSLAGKTGFKLSAAKAANAGKALLLSKDVVDGMKDSSGYVDADKVMETASLCVLGHETALKECRKETKNVKPSQSLYLHTMNSVLGLKVKMSAYHIPYSPTSQRSIQNKLSEAHGTDVTKCHEICSSLLQESGLQYDESRAVPGWMMQKSEEELLRMSDYYTSTALEMKRCGVKERTIGGVKMSLSDISQRAADYASAAVSLQQQAREQQELEEEREREAAFAASSTVEEIEDESQSETGTLKKQQSEAQDQWGGLMEALGLKGAGDISDNLGYTLAMLPDMIFGMLSGKSKNLRIEDNIFPLMAIFGGMFLKNPLLKWLLIGLGSVNLLNKGFGEVSGRDARQAQAATYKKYADEPISPRVKFHGVRDGQLIMDIDGKANIVRVSDDALQAYREGSLSEGALCNAVLRDYDTFVESSRHQYEMDAQQQDRQVVRMGVG